jgi:hypothetical protein
MDYGFEIDPRDVLGVNSESSLAEIHEAFRAKSKKHHPDVGGDEWAFRVVTRSYEILSSQRVMRRVKLDHDDMPPTRTTRPEPSAREQPRAKAATASSGSGTHRVARGPDGMAEEWVRPGVEDLQVASSKIVDIELFTLRFELASPLDFLESPQNRNLSCCLTATWPSPELADFDVESKEAQMTLKILAKVFSTMPKKTRATGELSRVTDGRFIGWMNYPTAIQAYQAFETLHEALLARGLGARQRSREMFLARE